MTVKPEIISFLIADKVFQEKGTNKWNAIGIFDKIYVDRFPCVYASLGLYFRVSDAEGEYKIRVEFCDDNDKRLALFEGMRLSVKSRLANPDFGIQTRGLPIQKPGKHFFNLYFNDEFVKSMPLIVEQISK